MSYYPHLRTRPPARAEVAICRDAVCRLAGGNEWSPQVLAELASIEGVEVREVSCLGRCDCAPAAYVNDTPVCVTTAAELRLWARHSDVVPPAGVTSTRAWAADPYRQRAEHYGIFGRVISDVREGRLDLCELLSAGELRGMGGAGFPTGRKWELVRNQPATPKYVICNSDESEPGTFKDRAILTELPHLVIEGMLLAGLQIGAAKGILFIRHEYQPELASAERAIADARGRGLLGTDILGSGWDFDIEVAVSMGGYILGEETALLEALEDRRAEPRNKPPFPGERGLGGQPTLINNVETLAFAPIIIDKGPEWWKDQGRGEAVGLKFIAVSGHVEQPDVFLVPMGTPASELIRMAGGVKDGRALKAFTPGGASSRFLPADKADVGMDFASLEEAGSMLGSGALMVVAEGTDMLDLAANLVAFFRNESCGKCVPCRQGTEKAVTILQDLLAGRGNPDQFDVLRELHETMEQTSICGLGQVALNPILSVMEHLPEELEKKASA